MLTKKSDMIGTSMITTKSPIVLQDKRGDQILFKATIAVLLCLFIIQAAPALGPNVIILPGIVVGENAVIGAGTVVTKSVPPNVVFAGNPGKIIRNIDK